MKVLFAPYPTAYQNVGGLKTRIGALTEELTNKGVTVKHFEPATDRISDFQLVHIFSASHGNHHMVNAANSFRVPVVLSSQLQPHMAFSDQVFGKLFDSVLGRLSNWRIRSSYGLNSLALSGANRIVVESEKEKETISKRYSINRNKIGIVPNGVHSDLPNADPGYFSEKENLAGSIILCVASINAWKNQKTLVSAARDLPVTIVLIGPTLSSDISYLKECLTYGSANVKYLGELPPNDSLLHSAYAAADVFALPSKGESGPISALEALAAGTPVVLTKNHGLDLDRDDDAWLTVDPNNEGQIRKSLQRFLAKPPPPDRCRQLVSSYSWSSAADKLLEEYEIALDLN